MYNFPESFMNITIKIMVKEHVNYFINGLIDKG
ncbi:hypothetical protein L288_09865 [Sphingobium quisquiliarum P25]|uniref:Uncharacterized protein n=1 Tax=Sphingobium quisquiliarum P25 TaxID=1329909 RepID=T0H384_9SPHN|nr:hypothetical protein L288_09865 [Sphingobium quisquiliarum P25]